MLRSLTIDQYRGFDTFYLRNLGRVNLLVGTNNCGKTSLLEAVELASAVGDAGAIWRIASRRGEKYWAKNDSRQSYSTHLDISHLFHGHELRLGSCFSFASENHTSESFNASIVRASESQRQLLFDIDSDDDDDSESGTAVASEKLALELLWNGDEQVMHSIPLTTELGISGDSIRRFRRVLDDRGGPVEFISTAGMTVESIVEMFESIVLTEEEEVVTESLRTIDPQIERLATIGGDGRRTYPGDRGGIVARLSPSKQRIPIGSMGDGIWRMLGLALSLASTSNGTLLVDEIDTGLHYSVMESMWRLIDETSRRLDIQVFATTHSRDCYESLASIARENVSENSEVTIQRIDQKRKSSVAFTEQEIIAAAERGMEVR